MPNLVEIISVVPEKKNAKNFTIITSKTDNGQKQIHE